MIDKYKRILQEDIDHMLERVKMKQINESCLYGVTKANAEYYQQFILGSWRELMPKWFEDNGYELI